MNILMLTEYFYPYDRGGSEWSTYHLAQGLIKKGHTVIILTPNYGQAKKIENYAGIKITRFNIGKILKNRQDSITPFWHTNPWWIITSTIALLKSIRKFHPDIIHAQGKYFLPAAGLAKILSHTPTIITLRDYQILCNLGLCLWHKNRRCTPTEFFLTEIKTYKHQYGNLSLIRIAFGRLISIWLRLWLKLVDQVVCVSHAQAAIFTANGIDSQVIYNTTHFSIPRQTHTPHHILFVGRFTPGKGANLLQPVFDKIKQRFPTLTLKIISHASHQQVLRAYKQATVVIIPSLWPEPFGRVALESIAAGTPVVTSDRGGLPEIVQGKYGMSVEPTITKLAQAAIKILKSQPQFTSQIKKDQLQLRHQFGDQPIADYLALYAQLLTRRFF